MKSFADQPDHLLNAREPVRLVQVTYMIFIYSRSFIHPLRAYLEPT